MILPNETKRTPAHHERPPLMNSLWTRRDFLARTAVSAASLALGTQAVSSQAPGRGSDRSPLRGRFLTHVSVVRVNQIEVTPTRNLGEDEVADNRPEDIRARREAFER